MDTTHTMTLSRARELIHVLYLTALKTRSILQENHGHDTVGMVVVEDLNRWLFGERNIVPLLERLDSGAIPLTPMVFYNLMTIANKLTPIIALGALATWDTDLPTADPRWIAQGWASNDTVNSIEIQRDMNG